MGRVDWNPQETIAMTVDECLSLLQREPGLGENTGKRRVPIPSFASAETSRQHESPELG